MVTPVDVSYSGPPPIRGGRPSVALPSWVPASGTIATVGLNTVKSLSDVAHPMAYGGAAWAPWLGRYGTQFHFSEGHTDGPRNDVIGFDHETRLYSFAKTAGPTFLHGDGYVGDKVSGWNYADTTGTAVQVGEAVACHMYGNTQALPPNIIPNTPLGSIVRMGAKGIAYTGGDATLRVQVLAIGEQLWTNPFNVELPFSVEYGCSLYDSFRNRMIMAESASFSQRLAYWDVNTPNKGTLNIPGTVDAYYTNGQYLAADDLYAFIRINPGAYFGQLRIVDPKDLSYYTPAMSGTAPLSDEVEGGIDWVESSRGFIYFPGTANVYFLKAPANPRTGVWVWSKIATLVGDIAATELAPPLFGRTRYIPALKAISYPPGYKVPMQLAGVTLP